MRTIYINPDKDIQKSTIAIEFTGGEYCDLVEAIANMAEKIPFYGDSEEDKIKKEKHSKLTDDVNVNLSRLTNT